MSPSSESVQVVALGRTAYEPVWELQQELQDRLIRAKRTEPPESLPHLLLLVEHPPVYTLGKNGDPDNLLVSREEAADRGVAFFEIDRGGDLTYHGPGQIVGYPILDLDRIFTDIGRYLRTLEETIIRTCGKFGVDGFRVDGRTGVWTGEPPTERKICAMGIRCSRWVTMHGFAFNVTTELDRFADIVPCGISDRGVTSLANELDEPIDSSAVVPHLLENFADCFDLELRPPGERSAAEVLGRYTPEASRLLDRAAEHRAATGARER